MFLTRAAIRNPLAVMMVCIAVVVLSLMSVSRIPADLFPNITVPVMVVSANYPGASPETMERTVTYPLERSLTGVSGVTQILSTTRQGAASIQLWFNWGTDLNSTEVQVIQNVQRVMRGLPTGVSQPSVFKFDISNIPVAQVVVNGGGLDARALNTLATQTIEPQLERIPGVSQATVNGGLVRQINVNVDPNKLTAQGLTLAGVQTAIEKNNTLQPSGTLSNSHLNYELDVPTLLQSVPAVQNVIVATRNGVPVRVADVAQVADAAAQQTQIVEVDGKPGVLLTVSRQPDANTIQVVNAVRAALPRLAGLPAGVSLNVGFDQSQYIRAALATLDHEALIGAGLTFLVVLVFLRSLWSLFIVGIGIPLSVASALLLLYFTGQTLNMFTMGGLTLAMGRLVDDAIVVRENITRHLAMPGRSVRDAVLDATQEVGLPVLASTATTIAVFFPVVFLSGISERLFLPMALTIAFALGASYFVSMSVDPVLSVALLRTPSGISGTADGAVPTREGRRTGGISAIGRRWAARSEQMMEWLDTRYQAILGWTLDHAALLIAAITVAFLVSVAAARGIGTEFFPNTDESQMSITLQAPQGTAVQATASLAAEAAGVVRQVVPSRDIRTIVTNSGSPSGGGGFSQNAGSNSASISAQFVPPTQRAQSQEALAARVRRALTGRFPGVQTFVSTGGLQSRIVNFGSAAPIDIQLIGFDQVAGQQLAQRVAGLLTQVPGATDVQIAPHGVYPAFQVQVDQTKAAQLGLTADTIAQAVNTAMSGNVGTASQFVDPVTGDEYNIVVQLQDQYRTHPDDLGQVPLNVVAAPATPGAAASPAVPVVLRDVAKISLSTEPLQISRKNEQRVIDVTANVSGRPLGAVSQDIESRLNGVAFPPGFTYHMAGQTEQQQSAFGGLAVAMLLALMLVYMIMVAQFQSLVDPFVIMFTVPLGIIGVIWMLLLTRTTLSIMSFMGVITMIGIVLSNGILLVDYTNKLRARGLALRDAILRAGRTRLRPILMTAIATILGMIPMAMGLGEGSETNMPLARAVIGGLVVSTALTLLLIPVLYMFAERWFPRRRTPGAREGSPA
jgi:hydrophobe/amphiphile efflux-1 (HAE1) family protein